MGFTFKPDFPLILVFCLVTVTVCLACGALAPTSSLGPIVASLDEVSSRYLIDFRTPCRNAVAMDITALGSTAVLSAVTSCGCALFFLRSRVADGITLLIAGAGAGLLSRTLKLALGRERPELSGRLVHVETYSFPSGHSLSSTSVYLMIGLLLARHCQFRRHRIVVYVMIALLVGSIGASRIYLGVHYMSDVLGGIFMGTAWILVLTKSASPFDTKN